MNEDSFTLQMIDTKEQVHLFEKEQAEIAGEIARVTDALVRREDVAGEGSAGLDRVFAELRNRVAEVRK